MPTRSPPCPLAQLWARPHPDALWSASRRGPLSAWWPTCFSQPFWCPNVRGSSCSAGAAQAVAVAAYRDEHLLDQFRAIGDQVLEALVDREDCEHGIAAHKGVAMLKVVFYGRDERLEDLSLLELAEESKCAAADVLVRVREVIPQVVAAGSGGTRS